MRIAQIAPLYESVPPKGYGGTERVVAYLTEELIRQGHEVTLFASGDSQTRAHLVSAWPRAIRADAGCMDRIAPHIAMLERVARAESDFDLVHSHVDYLAYPLLRRLGVPHVTTLHGRLDLPELRSVHREYRDMPVVSISNAQRAPLPWLPWQGTIFHGIPEDLYTFQPRPGDALAFLGRVSKEKCPERAVAVAKATGRRLRIAAKIDPVIDQAYLDAVGYALLKDPAVEYVGEIDETTKNQFLGEAAALLFLIDWPEPFGMVLIEAMACGTPVIAYRRGSVPEIVEEGVTGFVVDSLDEAAAAVEKIPTLDRKRIRRRFEERFTARHMTENYLTLYDRVLWKKSSVLKISSTY